MPAVKLINPNRVNIHGILFERGVPRYVTNEIAEALSNDERFEIRDGEDTKGGVKIKRTAKPKQADKTETAPENPYDPETLSADPVDNGTMPTNQVIEV